MNSNFISCRRMRGFTLLELLVVIGIMAMLSTVSIAGYFAAVRGMAERGAITDVRALIESAAQRAFIDQKPTAVFFYNTVLSQATSEENAIVAGSVVAVRMAGRISRVDGTYLYNEFEDLASAYPTNSINSASSAAGLRLYRFSGGNVTVSMIDDSVVRLPVDNAAILMSGSATNTILSYAFKPRNGVGGWKAGDAYGFEISAFQLPKGFIFGSSIPSATMEEAKGVSSIFFDPGSGSVNYSVQISACRPGPGGMAVQSVGVVKHE